MGLLDGRVALVTGAGSGIGAATAHAFAANGARLIVVDIDAEAAAATSSSIAAAGGVAVAHGADAAAPEEIERVLANVDQHFGRLDVLHNNHVWFENGDVEHVSLDGFRRSLDVGLTSYMFTIKTAMPMLLRNGGSIINTSSVCGLGGDYGLTAYDTLKAGVIGLTRSVAVDYASRGVRCNAICPGPTLTPPYRMMQEQRPELLAATRTAVPMGRFAEPSEIAGTAVFLASDLASYVTGTTLVVDGGLSAWTALPPVPAM
jgi:meso-butanediol dehydrogenase/(S,S)-butanediol dehydrogenase/diacetyl reductase